MSSVNGFTGTVTLAANSLPSAGLNCTFYPTSVTLGPTGISTLACSGLAGTYAVTITATSENLSHTTTVDYIIQDSPISGALTELGVGVGALAFMIVVAIVYRRKHSRESASFLEAVHDPPKIRNQFCLLESANRETM